MERKYVYLVGIILIIISAVYWRLKPPQSIKYGIYVSIDELSSLSIKEDGTFKLSRSRSTNYDPNGDYIIDGNKLILRVNGNEIEKIQFRINNDILIFESGRLAENIIKKGRKFIYEVQKKQLHDYRPMISLGKLLYFDTSKTKKELSQEWVEVGLIEDICSSGEPMKMESDKYIANDFSVGTKVYGKYNDLDILYVKYNDNFIEYILQNSQN